MLGTKSHILYVEDDAKSRKVAELLFQKVIGLSEITIFDSTEDIIAKIEALQMVPQYIFLDIQIEPLDGIQVLELLRKHPAYKDSVVIALTANVMATDIELLRNQGFNGLIGKPIRMQVFPELLNKIFAGEEVWYVS